MSYRRPIPRFNILDFGAHADSGTTDNSPALAAAFAAAVANGRGIVEVSDDPENPTGYYDFKSSVGVVSFPSGDQATYGLDSTGFIPRLHMNTAIGAGNDWLRLVGTNTQFTMKSLAFFSDDDAVLSVFQMIECIQLKLDIANCAFVKIGAASTVLYLDQCASWMNNCFFVGGNCATGFGILTYDTVLFGRMQNVQFLDSLTGPEANIRVRDPGEYPNIASWSCSFIAQGMVFGEQCKYTINVEPVTPGARFPYVELSDIDFQPNSSRTTNPPAADSCSLRLTKTNRVEVRRCAFNWQTFPMEMMVAAFDAGDLVMDACQGVVGIQGGEPLGNQRIYTDELTKSVKLIDCSYIYLDSTCPDIKIVRGNQETIIVQDTTGGGSANRIVVDDTIVASVLGVAGSGGTGTAGLLATPGAANLLQSSVMSTDGTTDASAFASESDAVVTNQAAACHVSSTTSAVVACDPAFQAAGPVDSSSAYAAGSGSTADQAVLTVTNEGASTHDFMVETKRRRVWSAWTPGVLIDVFGPYNRFPPAAIPLIAGWYDHSTLVNTGGFVATWKDRSGQHNDLIAAGAARPVYTAVGNAGLPQADFAGAQRMTTTFAIPWTTGGTLWTVGTFTGASQTHAAVAVAGGAFAAGDFTLWETAGSVEEALMSGGGAAPIGPLAGWHTRAAACYTEGADLWRDGTAVATNAATQVPGTSSTLVVGDRQGGGVALVGSLQLVMVFTQVLPTTLQAQLESWAKATYGTP